MGIIDVRGVHKRFGRKRVLIGADLRVNRGEVVAVLGENGGGKSTLLKLMAGSLRPDRGVITIDGKVGFCPQDCVLYPYLTPDEHLELFGAVACLERSLARSRGGSLLDRFGVAKQQRTCVVQDLSGGTRQKINLAIALLADPPALLLDEPYNGFDVETYHSFLEWAKEAKRLGKAVVIVTHIAFDQERFDRILTLRDGVIR